MTPPNRRNRLADAQSPYLRQHDENPVDWYPWGNEAFATARRLDRPIFLSIGYSTCHWCHVMAHESFEDEAVATRLNAHFVSVKVDREERPDVDHIYMTACQMMTGSGGWPLTLMLTPDLKPFFAATYLPRTERYGRPGLMEILDRVGDLWQQDRTRLLETSQEVARGLAGAMGSGVGERPELAALEGAVAELARRFDAVHGGFGQGTKFPTPHNLTLLLRHARRTGNKHSLHMATRTLDAMWTGGLYDHLAGGFHRYSTEPTYRLPHFEKMLYDQALLLVAYLEAYQLTGHPRYRTVATEVFDYVMETLRHPDGGFYSAEDADSEGEEGRFYVWAYDELAGQLTKDELALAESVYGVLPHGNYQDPIHPDAPPRNVLYRAAGIDEPAGQKRQALSRLRARLLALRERRERPGLDDKVMTDWNGLMIAALAMGARVLGERAWLDAAMGAARFVDGHLRSPQGQLLHRYRNGEAGIEGQLDDYAFYGWGLLELYQTSHDPEYLASALTLVEEMAELFAAKDGALALTRSGTPDLIVRPVEHYDGALPAGNSVAAELLVRLGRLCQRESLEARAAQLLESYGQSMERQPSAHCRALQAVEWVNTTTYEVVIAVPRRVAEAALFLDPLRTTFRPDLVVHVVSPDNRVELSAMVSSLRSKVCVDERPTAYLCSNGTCQLPVTEPQALLDLLNSHK